MSDEGESVKKDGAVASDNPSVEQQHIVQDSAHIRVSEEYDPQMPSLPIEVWEQVIDLSWEFDSVKACSLTVLLKDKKQVAHMARLVRREPYLKDAVKKVVLMGGDRDFEVLPHFGTFAAMLARQLTRAAKLEVHWAKWQTGLFHPDVFLHMTAFTSITHLRIYFVSFPSVLVFGRFVSALPQLKQLECAHVHFENGSFDKRSPVVRSFPTQFVLDGITGVEGVIDFVVGTTISAKLEELVLWRWGSVSTRDLAAHYERFQRLLQVIGSSLVSFEATLNGMSGKEPESDVKFIGSALNLSSNTNLEVLKLVIQDICAASRGWVDALLKTVSTKKLREVHIVYRWMISNPSLEIVLTALNEEECRRIDDFLTGKQFSKLTQVSFGLYTRQRNHVLPAAQAWWGELSSRFPKLRAKGIFRTTVLVDYMAL
ncbi:uncharacterized protein FIBRA_02860 [Fibroporia radiculosa]|uniref:F-box domain-containing protein n=1 Tax=Fibroporia radiculosa TaxID=599839 RepID=J4G328_9APHY|nr:uncharacterized protein FIBRA_02860 [Fibroporia radiculosa]CCM00818.1 predicted protein [Fibroporia radiculosa]